jgi:NTP pyrophosphatase (non-canonical NTP hydrolase)
MQHLKDAKELNDKFLRLQSLAKAIFDALKDYNMKWSDSERENLEDRLKEMLYDISYFLNVLDGDVYVKSPYSKVYNRLTFNTDYSTYSGDKYSDNFKIAPSLFEYVISNSEGRFKTDEQEKDLRKREKNIKRSLYYVNGQIRPELY